MADQNLPIAETTEMPVVISNKIGMPGETIRVVGDGNAFAKAIKEHGRYIFIASPEEGDNMGVIGLVQDGPDLVNGNILDAEVTVVSRGRADPMWAVENGIPYATVEKVDITAHNNDPEVAALAQSVLTGFLERNEAKFIANGQIQKVMELKDRAASKPATLADLMIQILKPGNMAEKRKHIRITDPKEQLRAILKTFSKMDIEQKVEDKLRDEGKKRRAEMEKKEKEFLLREQLAEIQKELGEGNEDGDDLDVFAKKIAEAGMPEQVRLKVEKELKKLRGLSTQDSNYAKVHEYIERLTSYPWKEASKLVEDLGVAEEILEADHYGLHDVKDRMIEQLAEQLLTGKMSGSIIVLGGPPGVGKTSIAKSVAKATGRKYVRVSLGGVNDEATIRGHSTTYVGAKPGIIMNAMEEAGTTNPLILLDEIDKMGQGNVHGDPTAAMLEVLDPAQNNSFRDRYTDVPYDLSNVLFLATANDIGKIPGPLLDRLELIEIEGYTDEEKLHIAKNYLLPKALEKGGLTAEQFSISDEAIAAVIDGYTREAGVRTLEKNIRKLVRKSGRLIQEGKAQSVAITPENLEEKAFMGPRKVKPELVETEPRVGRVNGLYVSGTGGGLLEFEGVKFPSNKGGYVVTGSLQDVMKESVADAYDYVRSHAQELGIPAKMFEEYTVRIKVGDGATPKDGPSAGLALATLITSILTDIATKPDVAMTGEVGLPGNSMPIGGVKFKLLGAQKAGATTVLIPEANVPDLADVSEKVKKELDIIPVTNVMEVLKNTLVEMPKPLSDEAYLAGMHREAPAAPPPAALDADQLAALAAFGKLFKAAESFNEVSPPPQLPANDAPVANIKAPVEQPKSKPAPL